MVITESQDKRKVTPSEFIEDEFQERVRELENKEINSGEKR